jgi:hypothetical protein
MAKTATTSRSMLRAPYDFDRRNKHCKEAAYFRSFYHFEPDIQSGVITHADSPDFRIRAGDNIIGVEVTGLFTSPDGPALESTQERIFDQACRKAERLNLPPAGVILFFNLRKPLRVADCRRIAHAVVKVVADNMPADGDMAELEHRPGQPSEVDLIHIERQYRREVGRWRADYKFSAIERNISDIVQEAITKKTARLTTYRKACDECWLLLVADSFMASGNLEFGEVNQTHTFSSPFMRTYVLDFGRGRLQPLKTAAVRHFGRRPKSHGASEARSDPAP